MPLLPKPYPDEIVGSIMLRGRRNLMMPLKPFLQWILQHHAVRGNCSFVLEPAVNRIAELCGVSPSDILLSHTFFGYATAFRPRSEVEAMKRQLLASSEEALPHTSSLVQRAVASAGQRKYCPKCADTDMKLLGETYWRLNHQLPTVYICSEHLQPLVRTGIPLSIGYASGSLSLPPSGATCYTAKLVAIREDTSLALLKGTQRALSDSGRRGPPTALTYQRLARAAGFTFPTGGVAATLVTKSLCDYYGPELLSGLRCEVKPGSIDHAWPALLLRSGHREPSATARHILVDTFLRTCKRHQGQELAMRTHMYRHADYTTLDCEAASRIRTELRFASKAGRRLTVRALLESAGIRAAYAHGSRRLPLCRALVEAFKRSGQSERQLGGRAHWRKRTPSR